MELSNGIASTETEQPLNGACNADDVMVDSNVDSARITIERRVYTQEQLELEVGNTHEKRPGNVERMKQYCKCSRTCVTSKLLEIFPCVDIMRHYQWKNWLPSDVIAGLCVGVIHIPQSLGFALLTSLPAVYGLYSSLYPLLIYFLFGTSRHISVGTMAVISLMIGAVVEREASSFVPTSPTSAPYAENQTVLNATASTASAETDADAELVAFKIDIATSVTLLVGVIQLLMYLLNLGVMASFMSMSFIGGFMTGAACHIVTSQVPFMLGIQPERYYGAFKLPKTWYSILSKLPDTQVAEIIIAVIFILVLYVLKEIINEKYKHKLKVPIPAELIVVVVAIVVSYFAKLNDRFDVRIINDVPTGLPAPDVPSMHNWSTYVADAFAIALISFAISMSLAKKFADNFGYDIRDNQELLAHGMMHAVGGFFSCFGGAQAPPRTLVHVSTGGKTQLASLVSFVMVLLVCLFMGPLMEPLPNSVLASIIVVALIPMFRQFRDVPMYFRISKPDGITWVASFLGVVIVNVDAGLYIGVVTSLACVIFNSKWAKIREVHRVGQTELFHPNIESVDSKTSVKIVKFDAPLYFANVDSFKRQLFESTLNPAAGSGQKPEAKNNDAAVDITKQNHQQLMSVTSMTTNRISSIIIDFAAVSYIDAMGVTLLNKLRLQYSDLDIPMVLTNCNGDVMAKLCRVGGGIEKHCYPSIIDAMHDAGGLRV